MPGQIRRSANFGTWPARMSNPSGWTDHGLKSIDSVLAKSIHISHRRDIFFSMKNSGKIVHCENHLDQKNCTFGLLFALGTYNRKLLHIESENGPKMVSFEFSRLFLDFQTMWRISIQRGFSALSRLLQYKIGEKGMKESLVDKVIKLDFFEDVYWRDC